MNPSNNAQKHIVAKPINKTRSREATNRDIWASICYYYPQYTLREASQLSSRDIRLLLATAKRLEAQKMLQLVQIAAAPYTKKGKGVKDLINHYQKELNS